jgi:hypothetical protein
MTNMGLRMELPLRLHEAPDIYMGVLDCTSILVREVSQIAILLKALPPGAGHLQFARIFPEQTPILPSVQYERYPLQTILVRQKIWDHRARLDVRWISILFSSLPTPSNVSYRLIGAWPADRWNESGRLLRITWREIKMCEPVGAFFYGRGSKREFVLIVGCGQPSPFAELGIWCNLTTADRWAGWQDMKNHYHGESHSEFITLGQHHRFGVAGTDWALNLAWNIGTPLGDQTVINIMAQEAKQY